MTTRHDKKQSSEKYPKRLFAILLFLGILLVILFVGEYVLNPAKTGTEESTSRYGSSRH